MRLTLDHLFGRIPVRPFLLVMNRGRSRPCEALAPHSDTVAQGEATLSDEIKITRPWLDYDCACTLRGLISHQAAQKGWIDPPQRCSRNGKGLVGNGSI